MTGNIENISYRFELIEKYLCADTTIEEERCLHRYYLSHEASEDEKAVAMLILSSHSDQGMFSDDINDEFDRIISESESSKPSNRSRIIRFTSAFLAVACSIALVVMVSSGYARKASPMQMTEIADCLSQAIDENAEDDISRNEITAKPRGNRFLVTETTSNETTVSKGLLKVSNRTSARNSNVQFFLNDKEVSVDVINRLDPKKVDMIRFFKARKNDTPVMAVTTIAYLSKL